MLDLAIWTTLIAFLAVLAAATIGIPVPRAWARAHAHRTRTLVNRPDQCAIPGCGSTGTLIAMTRPDGVVGMVCGRCGEELAAVHGWERLASRHARTSA